MNAALDTLVLATSRALLRNAEARLDHAQATLAEDHSNHPFDLAMKHLDHAAALVVQRRAKFSALCSHLSNASA